MKVVVDRAVCSSYGMCVQSVPAVFTFDLHEKLVIAVEVPSELEDRVRFACEQCPTQALSIEE